MDAWPFTASELTAALRRYLADPTLAVLEVREEPLRARRASGRLRGVGIDVERAGHQEHYSYVVKEPKSTTNIGLDGAGWREIGLYRSLAAQLPVAVPELVTGDAAGSWLMLEPHPSRVDLNSWTADNYRRAVVNLAHLHDRFWGLDEDLSVYPWLGRPLTSESEMHLLAAAKAMETIVLRGAPPIIAGSVARLAGLARLIAQGDFVAKLLQSTPQTLLHGDYWPGNISVDEDGQQVVYDWAMVSIGPGVLDLVVFINMIQLTRSSLPVAPSELIAIYRGELTARTRHHWTQREWDCLWDFAQMWRFVQQWFGRLSVWGDPPSDYSDEAVERVWIEPILEAVGRWLSKLQ